MFSGLFAKLAGTAIGGFFKSYGMWVAIAGILAAIMALVIYVHGAESAKANVTILKQEIKTVKADYLQRLNRASIAVKACTDVNLANYKAAEAQRERANKAAKALAEAEIEAAKKVGDINREFEALRQRGLACPALDNQFRKRVREYPN